MRSFTFKWPHHAEEVYVTGTFDHWTKSERLERVGQLFEKTVTFPESSDKIYYKFVVDGNWITDHAAPQEKDHEGNENNVLLPEQMDKLDEEASQAAAINNLVPESTTAQLAGAVPLEDKKEEGEGASSDAAILNSAAPESTTAQLAAAVPLEDKKEQKQEDKKEEGDAAILSSAAPESTTAQLAAAVPLEETKETASPPGGYPETPATELDKEVKISPLPAAEGAINPIKLAPGEEVPKDLTAGAIDTHVTLDEESYEKSDRIPGIDTTLPVVTGNMIPESSLPITGANDVAITTAAPQATTTALAGEVPLEPKVPEVVKQSQEEAKVEPEASANTEEVKEKAAVEEELLEKVGEAPSTSEGTAGQGTEKSETDKTAAENVLAAATTAGEVALGAAITAGGAAAEIAAKTGDAVTDATSKATVAASAVAHDAATHLPDNVKEILPGAAQEAEAEAEKQKAAIDAVSPEVPAEVKESMKEANVNPEAAVNTAVVEEKKGYEADILEKVKPAEAAGESSAKTTEEEQKAAIENVSAGVPAEVKESLQEAGASPEAAVNAVAVDEKREAEAELLDKVKPAEAVGESPAKTTEGEQKAAIAAVPAVVPAEVKESLQEALASPEAAANTAAVEEKKEAEAELLEKVKPAGPVAESSPRAPEDVKPREEARPGETLPKPMDESAPAEAPHGETKPKPAGEGTALAVEPPQPVTAVKTVDEGKPAETPKAAEEAKPTGDLKLTEDIAPAVTALAVEPPQPVEEVKTVDAAKPAESSLKAADEPKPAEAAPAVAGPTEVAEPRTDAEPVTAIEGATETEASNPTVEHPATTGQAAPVEAAKPDEVHPATNGTTTTTAPASSSIQSQTDKSTSEKKKKNRISGFFSKLKHKFA